MRKLLIAGLFAAAASTAPATASVLPYGVQTNISAGDIAGWGFTQCFSGSYAGNENIATILSGCQGGALMMASKAVGSNIFNVAAAGLREDVLFSPSSINYNNYNNLPASERTLTHEANGVEWYFGDHWSWGFAPADASVDRYSCDVGPGNDQNQRLCWHTYNGNLDYGYSAGGQGNGYGGTYERFLFVADAPGAEVPEPAMLALFGLGAIGLGLSRRRRAA